MRASDPDCLLVISGLDPGGGAGFIADIRVAAEHGLRAVGVVTALTVQDTAGVRAVQPVAPELVRDQLEAVLADIPVRAVKIGMLGAEATARAVSEALALTAAPVVWDPILCPTLGHVALLDGDPLGALAALAPHLACITPNAAEAAALVGAARHDGHAVRDAADAERAGAALRELGCDAALVKGGHLDGAPVDVLVTARGVTRYEGERVADATGVHGTGCALATALACQLAAGAPLEQAAGAAKAFVAGLLRAPVSPGRGARSVL